jgi:hypothetical protein
LVEHLAIGGGIVLGGKLAHGAPWMAVILASLLGLWHETYDGDFKPANGGPWNGLIDVLAFLVVPLVWWAW